MPYDTVSCSSSVTQVILLVSLISFSMWPISSVVVLLLSTVEYCTHSFIRWAKIFANLWLDRKFAYLFSQSSFTLY